MFLGKQSGVGKAEIVVLTENDVVKNADSEDLRSFGQALRAVAVLARGSRVSGRMVVQEHDRRRAVQQCRFPNGPTRACGRKTSS